MAISREEQLKILGLMQDSEINYADAPATNEEFWQNATVNLPPVKVPVTLRLEADVLAWHTTGQCPPIAHQRIASNRLSVAG